VSSYLRRHDGEEQRVSAGWLIYGDAGGVSSAAPAWQHDQAVMGGPCRH
jgi:hypothetical protein